MNVYPIKEAWAGAQAWMQEGFEIHQQFLCAKCGIKQTMDEPNKFFTRGTCQECGHESNLLKDGCNYMAIGRNEPQMK